MIAFIFAFFVGLVIAIWRVWAHYLLQANEVEEIIPDPDPSTSPTTSPDTFLSPETSFPTSPDSFLSAETAETSVSVEHAIPIIGQGCRLLSPGAVILRVLICILGGLAIGFLSTIPGALLGEDTFLRRLSHQLFLKKIHAPVNNYCNYINFNLQLTIAAAYFTQILAIFATCKLCERWGKKTTLVASTLLMIVGVALIFWFPNTPTLVCGFFILNIGVGFTSEVISMIKAEIEQICPHALAIAKLVGTSASHLVNYIDTSLDPKYTWRWSFGCLGVILMLLLSASISLKYPTLVSETRSYKILFQPKYRPPLYIALLSGALSFFSVVSVFQFYGPMLFKSSGLPDQANYIPPLIISLIQVVFAILSILFVRCFGRRKQLLLATSTKVLTELTLAIIYYTSAHRLSYFEPEKLILFYTIGCINVAADAILKTPMNWLDVSFPRSAKAEGSIIEALLGPFSESITALVSVLAICKLHRLIFIPYLVMDLLIASFVSLLLPETTNIKEDEIVGNVWSQHWFWRRYVKEDDTYA